MDKRARSRGVVRKSPGSPSVVASSQNPPLPTRSPKSVKCSPQSVHLMTSRDFQLDINAHLEVAAYQLKDYVYLRCFQAAILQNKHLFRGRTVLDIGCGVGILSLFAAKAGAARIYAVDSSNVVDYTRQIVQDNGYADVIEVIKGCVEEIELPTAQVDIIICNWLGYSLLFQSTCDAVIFARDKWLKAGGLIFPDVAKLFVAALEDNKYKNERVEWWNDVYGVNMQCMRDFALSEPSFQMVLPQQLLSTQFGIKYLNMYTAKKEDLKFRCKYMLEMQRSGRMDGLVTYFYVFFSKSHTPMGLNTDPSSPRTRWMQTVFFFDKPVYVNSGELYYGGIEMYSPEKEGDLNNMEVGLEMYSGDPMQLHLETEMRWKLKPHAAVITSGSSGNSVSSSGEEGGTKSTVENVEAVAKPEEVALNCKRENSHNLNMPVCSIVIGDQTYPMGKRGKKAKHTKKG